MFIVFGQRTLTDGGQLQLFLNLLLLFAADHQQRPYEDAGRTSRRVFAFGWFRQSRRLVRGMGIALSGDFLYRRGGTPVLHYGDVVSAGGVSGA